MYILGLNRWKTTVVVAKHTVKIYRKSRLPSRRAVCVEDIGLCSPFAYRFVLGGKRRMNMDAAAAFEPVSKHTRCIWVDENIAGSSYDEP